MLKFVIVGAASLALVGSAVAADLPRPQNPRRQVPDPGCNQGLNPAARPQRVPSFAAGTRFVVGTALRVESGKSYSESALPTALCCWNQPVRSLCGLGD